MFASLTVVSFIVACAWLEKVFLDRIMASSRQPLSPPSPPAHRAPPGSPPNPPSP